MLATYDPFGGYGHPDHIQAHRVAMYAARSWPPCRRTARTSVSRGRSPKIYWNAMSESRMRAGLRALRDAGDATSFEGMDPDGPLPAVRHGRREPRRRAWTRQDYVDAEG